MSVNLELHGNITDLPRELCTTFFIEPDPQWTTSEIAAAFDFVKSTGSKPGVIWGGSVRLQKGSRLLRRKPELRVGINHTLYPFSKLEAKGTGRRYPRWNCPSWTKCIITNPHSISETFAGTNVIDKTGGDRSGRVVLLGIHKSKQLIVCTGGVINDTIAASDDPLLANFSQRQMVEFGMNVDVGSHYPAWWIQDGGMNHIIQHVTYTCSAEWIRACFSSSSDAFEALVVVRDDLQSIQAVCDEYDCQGYKPWKWIVPLAQRDHSLIA